MGADFHERVRRGFITARVRNKDRLYRKLTRLAPDIQQALAEETGRSAAEMVAIARSYVAFKTGRLRDSIVATPGGQETPLYSQPGGSTRVPLGATMVTAGNIGVRIAHLVEYGTRPHINAGIFAGTQHPGTPAQPFFWPAYRLMRRRIRSRTTRALNKVLKAAGR